MSDDRIFRKRGPWSVLIWNLTEVVVMVGVGIAIGYCARIA
jgi:hypothetical protein